MPMRYTNAKVTLQRNGQRADVPKDSVFNFTEEEMAVITRANPSFLRKADNDELRFETKFEDLKGLRTVQVKAQAAPVQTNVVDSGAIPEPVQTDGEVTMTKDQLEQLNVTDLKAIVARRELKPSGEKKADLVTAILTGQSDETDL